MKMKKKYSYKYSHDHHIVEFSYWPFFLSIFIFYLFFCFGCLLNFGFINFYIQYKNLLYLSLYGFFSVLSFWFNDLIKESIIEGHNTRRVNFNFLLGMILFILSEVMFFFAFFWSYFHFSLNPSMQIGACWPPYGILVIPYNGLPLINTCLLLSSGVTITWSHIALKEKSRIQCILGLFLTICLALLFLRVQMFEFQNASFTIADSVYGSIFFFITGLHGSHVFIGMLLLTVSFLRISFDLINLNYSSGFEFSVWYWHFVDVVWLFVMLIVYCWGN